MKHLTPLVKRSAQLTVGLACAVALVAGIPSVAGAQVLTTDNICGKAADARGIAAEDLPDIDASNAFVMGKNGTVYYARSADEQVKIASITKVMTAILAVENCKMDEKITVSNAAAAVGNSTAGLLEGDELTVEQALRGLMIPSGNDAAIALAEHVGKKLDPKTKDAVATFVKAMNEQAKKLGCTGTLFENPHGLDFDEWAGDMHSTAHDVALMMQEAMKDDTIREVMASKDPWIEVTGADGSDHSHSMDTHNVLLDQDGNIGGKTGTTDDAGYCFASAYNRDGDEIYTVVLNSSTTDQRFADTATLASWYYDHKVTVEIANTQKKTANGNPLMARVSQTDWTDKTIDATLADPTAQATVFSLAGEVTEKVSYDDLSGTVHVGDKVGSVTLKQDGTKIAVMDLVADEEGTGPNPIEWLLVKLDRLGRRIDNRPLTAESETVAKAPEV
ncbi:MAG: D-alanyl-D-alanine carboxypeptidase [Collinsella sp.]|nr:D-alanyl-D-alanine carboxypeptidase [Collinsella sp.]MCI6575757.1 D-alanyl-D-alanine carboxypeptidase [Collinsella sp.]MCI7144822.1 D-alanyl-D-alanine carboxypeptidase [Collinsella sp.]MDY4863133.1 D-alanyl-D-alanine carboxypeptidase family protein [Collinsella sp.]